MGDLGHSIVSGVAAGFIAGLMVAIVLAANRWIDENQLRNEQIRHVRELIASERANMYSVSEQFDPLPDGSHLDLNMVRYAHFDFLRKELDLALDGRSSEITFDEIRQIRRVFIRHDLIRSAAPDRLPEGLTFYNGIFQSLEEIEWLKLPRVETETP